MKQDLLAKRYYSDNRRFADLNNGIVCNGIPIVKQEDLSEMDTETSQGKRRDLVRKAVFGVNFAVLGLENQEKLDYRLPLRVLGYEAGEYEHQAAEIYREIRRSGRNSDTELSSGEYLYGFRKSDRLHPVITIILYYGEEEWDGSRDLHGILDFQDIPEQIRQYVQNYRIHVIDVRRMERTDLFRTDLRQVFDLIRFSGNRERLRDLIEQEPAYGKLEEDAFDFASSYVGLRELSKWKEAVREGERFNMKTGFQMYEDEFLERGRAEGKEIGRAEGKEIGRAEGKEIGRAEGKELGRVEATRSVIQSALALNLPVEQIAQICSCGVDRVKQIQKTMEKVSGE